MRRRRRVARGPKDGHKTAYLSAAIDEDRELHLYCTYRASPQRTMRALVQTAEKWVSLSTGGAPRRPTLAVPERVFSFLDTLGDADEEQTLRSMTAAEKEYFLTQNGETRGELQRALRETRTAVDAPLRFRVLRSRLPLELKRRISSKLERQNENSGDAAKYTAWVETLLALPLGEHMVPQPTLPLERAMAAAKAHLESVIFGHRAAKAALLERFYMWLVAPFAVQQPVALCGVPGNGKTTLIREGLAGIMGRPFAFISLGGSADSSVLLGHSYTYEGSTPGRVVEHLIAGKCANPIFYFDELDKCSSTPKGDEIINALVHFTDPAQSDVFRDRYVGNLDIDTSRSLCVFSFNNPEAVSGVLLDRIQVVTTDSFDSEARCRVAAEFLLPKLLRQRGIEPGRVRVSPGALRSLALRCPDGGVRALRSVLDQAISKVSMWRDAGDADFLLPLLPADVEIVDERLSVNGGLERLLDSPSSRGPPGMYL
jgi:ATP-dependent Lon protease